MSDPDQTVILPRQREALTEPDPTDAEAAGATPEDHVGIQSSATPAATGQPVTGDPQAPDPVETDAQTAVLPRLEDGGVAPAARPDAWDSAPTPRGTAPVTGAPFGRRRALGAMAWLVTAFLTAGLGLIRLNWASMRASELTAWAFTGTPWRLVPRLVHDTPPGDVPYFVFLKAWATLFGRSDFALRVPSVVAMSAAGALLAVLVTRLSGPRAGLLAGLLLAVVPATSRYGQEAGPQALTVFAAVLATLALVALFDRPSAARVLGYLAAVVLLSLGSLAGLLVVLAHGLLVLGLKRRALVKWFIAAVIGVAPAIAVMTAIRVYPWLAAGASPPRLPSVSGLAHDAFGAALVAGMLFGFGLLALSLRKPAVVFTAWAVLPLVLLPIVLRFTTIGADQVALLALPGWVGLGGLGLCRPRVVRAILATLLVAAVGVPDQLAVRRSDGHGQASHQLADVLYTQAKPGDVMLFGPAAGDGPAGRDIVYRYLSAAHRPNDILARGVPGADGHRRTPECIDVNVCLGPAARVWLIRVGTYDSPLTGLEAGKDGALRVRYTVFRSWNLTGVSLTLFTLKKS